MNILGIDYGTKYIGVAKKDTKHNVIMPVGYISNDGGAMFELSNIIEQYQIKQIVIGWPRQEKGMQEKIDKFIKEIQLIYPMMKIIKVIEDYTSVEAAATTGEFKKARGKEDTIAAMKILERLDN